MQNPKDLNVLALGNSVSIIRSFTNITRCITLVIIIPIISIIKLTILLVRAFIYLFTGYEPLLHYPLSYRQMGRRLVAPCLSHSLDLQPSPDRLSHLHAICFSLLVDHPDDTPTVPFTDSTRLVLCSRFLLVECQGFSQWSLCSRFPRAASPFDWSCYRHW